MGFGARVGSKAQRRNPWYTGATSRAGWNVDRENVRACSRKLQTTIVYQQHPADECDYKLSEMIDAAVMQEINNTGRHSVLLRVYYESQKIPTQRFNINVDSKEDPQKPTQLS